MKLNTNSLKVKQLSLEEGPMKYRTKNEDSVRNETERHSQCKDSSQLLKGIICLIWILFIIGVGLIVFFEVPYDAYVPNLCSINAVVDTPVRMDDIKDDGPSVNFNSVPWKDKQWTRVEDDELMNADNSMTDCNMLDRDLLDERRARLEASKSHELTQKQKTFWDAIPSAWNARSLSEIPLDDSTLDNMMVLTMMKQIVANASLELREEGYELLHDLFLEEQQLQNQTEKWFEWIYALGNFTDNIPSTKCTPALALNSFVILGKGFNLHYQEIEIGKDDSNKFLFGKFVYLGEKYEELYVRHVRHILNGVVRLYFKIHNPSVMSIMCGDSKLENDMKNAEIMVLDDVKEESIEHPIYSASSLKPPASRTIRSPNYNTENLTNDPNLVTSKRYKAEEQQLHSHFASKDLEPSLENFFDRMEILSAHIDRLHERYMKLNELNDDYVSREFSVESGLTDNRIV